MTWKIALLNLTKHLHHKTIITTLGVIVDLPNTQRQKGETSKYDPNEIRRKFPRKRIKWYGNNVNARCSV